MDYECNMTNKTCVGACKVKLEEELSESLGDEFILRHKCQTAIQRHSSKLKQIVHEHINELVELLKARELQLFLEVEEKSLAQSLALDTQFSELCAFAARKGSSVVDDNCNCFGLTGNSIFQEFSNVEQNFKFVSNITDDLKKQLQTFGSVELLDSKDSESFEIKESPVALKNVGKKPKFSQTIIKKLVDQTSRMMKKRPVDGKCPLGSNESLDSITSFEIIETFGKQLKDYDNVSTSSSCTSNGEGEKNSPVAEMFPPDSTSSFREQLRKLRINEEATKLNTISNNVPDANKYEGFHASEEPSAKLMKQMGIISKSCFVTPKLNNDADLGHSMQQKCSFPSFSTDLEKSLMKEKSEYTPPNKSSKLSATVVTSFDRFFRKENMNEWLSCKMII